MNRMWMRRAAVTCVCVCVRVCECVWHLACYEWCWWVCVCMCVYMCMCMCACVCVRVRLFGILHVINTRTCHDAFCLFSWHLVFFFRGGWSQWLPFSRVLGYFCTCVKRGEWPSMKGCRNGAHVCGKTHSYVTLFILLWKDLWGGYD